MRELITLIIRNGGFFTFLLLESLSLYLVVQFNPNQEKIYYSSLNNVVAKIDAAAGSTADYFQLKEYADSLARANAYILQQLDQAKYYNLARKDTIYAKNIEQQYVVTPAEIISNSVSRTNNYLILNKGRKDGVGLNSAVISETGIVGIVIDATSDYCQVMSMLHRQARVSAKIKRTNSFGSISWDGSNYRNVQLNDVPKHVKPILGDTVVTSGFSHMFPKEMSIGVITEFELKGGSNNYNIEVQLLNDLSNLKYCYIVNNLKKSQVDSLENSTLKIN